MSQPARLVIDPNVYVSAAITPAGTCGQLVDAVDDSEIVAVSCPHLLVELEQVLLRPKLRRYVVAEEVAGYCETIRARSEHHPDPVDVPSHTSDPKDDYLVALAIDAHVDAIVSGDPDLLQAEVPVQVWSPRESLDMLVRR
jgi:putative PIN family toxin of toxin-antitoxin system